LSAWKLIGYALLEARDGQEAVEVYKNNKDRVDLVILDMRMPLNGGNTFEQPENIDSDLKTMLTSGYTEDYSVRLLVKQGCIGFLQKPFDFRILSEKIKATLNC